MINRSNRKTTLLTAILIAVSFSCKQTASVIYGTNRALKEKSYYLKKFERKNIDVNKVYFVDKESVESELEFLMSFHSNAYYYYFGTIYNDNNQVLFKGNQGAEFGCKQVIKNLKDEKKFKFYEMPETKQAFFDKYSFNNSINTEFLLSGLDKKTIIFIYNHSMGNVFFKDAKEIIDFSNSNPKFDYVILMTDFFNYSKPE